jgi:hypothetical protein
LFDNRVRAGQSSERGKCDQAASDPLVEFGFGSIAVNPVRRMPGQRDQSCIFIFLAGGPSHLDTFDPKPDAPADICGAFGSVATRGPGVRLSDKLPRMATL